MPTSQPLPAWGDGHGSVRDEENCFRFDILRNRDNPNQFLLHEMYANREAHTTHGEQPHYVSCAPQWSACLRETWAASKWRRSSPPTTAGAPKSRAW